MRGQSSRTSSTMWVERMTVTLRADGAEEIEEAVALGGVETGGGLVDDDELWVGEQRLGDAEALLHAAGVGAERFLAGVPEIGLLEEGVDHLGALGLVGDAFEDGEMVEHVERRHLGVDAELLREIAEDFADLVFLREDVETVEVDGAGSRGPGGWRRCA